MHPISFVKAHPLATLVLLGVGAVALPGALSMVGAKTGVSVSLPRYGNGS